MPTFIIQDHQIRKDEEFQGDMLFKEAVRAAVIGGVR